MEKLGTINIISLVLAVLWRSQDLIDCIYTSYYIPGRSRIESFTPTNSDSLAHDLSQLASDLEEVAMEVGSLEVNSLVEVTLNGRQHFGVVRWSGKPKDSGKSQNIVGVELVRSRKNAAINQLSVWAYRFLFIQENEVDEGTDGSYLGHQYFRCASQRGVFVHEKHCKIDTRFNGSSAVCDMMMKPSPSSPSSDLGVYSVNRLQSLLVNPSIK